MKNAYCEVETASRYDSARSLPPETKTLWLDELKSAIPAQDIRRVLDLGCGTGRFTSALSEAFGCPAVGVEPSRAMLDVAKGQKTQDPSTILWKLGQAEAIPLQNQSADLVFMSQVFHHLAQPWQALNEIARVLTPNGFLAIRNGTREHNSELAWLKFFPGAREIEDERTPSAQELQDFVCGHSPAKFGIISHRVIHQLFAASHAEYYEKVSQRGLSALIAISDKAFQAGLEQFKRWASLRPGGVAVYEPVDLFVFRKAQPGQVSEAVSNSGTGVSPLNHA